MTDERPTINLAVHEGVGDEQLTQVLLGIEEEGVPSRVDRLSELNPLVLAHRAATSSRLGIGLGIALDYVVITTEKLPERRTGSSDRTPPAWRKDFPSVNPKGASDASTGEH